MQLQPIATQERGLVLPHCLIFVFVLFFGPGETRNPEGFFVKVFQFFKSCQTKFQNYTGQINHLWLKKIKSYGPLII